MHNLRRWYYDNRDKIWITLLVAAIVLAIIKILNNYYKNEKKTPQSLNVVSTKQEINTEITGKLNSTTSIISGTSKSTDMLKKHTKIIDEFINNCNEGNINRAYELLSDECKENIFPTVEKFKNIYYNNVFSNPKTYSIQNWTKDTYKLKIIDDPLYTGKINSNDTYFQEYITIVSKDKETKLNINNYIGRTTSNKVTKTDELKITFIKKETYIDYEEYTINVTNLSNKEIVIDKGESTKTIYLLDENNIKQYANAGEINYGNLVLLPRDSKEYTFRFSNSYSTTRVMQKLVLEQVLIKNVIDDERVKISINL